MSVLGQLLSLLSSILTILLTCPNNNTLLCYRNKPFLIVQVLSVDLGLSNNRWSWKNPQGSREKNQWLLVSRILQQPLLAALIRRSLFLKNSLIKMVGISNSQMDGTSMHSLWGVLLCYQSPLIYSHTSWQRRYSFRWIVKWVYTTQQNHKRTYSV